ncbi:MAG: SAM hydroxide adenosyltransferase, partial [Myxococcales bacterium]
TNASPPRPPRPPPQGGAVVGEVLYVDPFGNLVSCLDFEDLPVATRDAVKVSVAGKTLHGIRSSYSEVKVGELVALINSAGRLEVGIREGSAADELNLDDPQGMPVVVEPL